MNTSKNLKVFAPILVVGILGGAIGAGITLAVKDSGASAHSTASTNTTKTYAPIYQPANVLANPDPYIGKTIALQGKIGKSPTAYYVIGTGKQTVGIMLDFSQSHIDPSKYFISPSKNTPPPSLKSLIFTGKLSKDKSGTPFLIVYSVK